MKSQCWWLFPHMRFLICLLVSRKRVLMWWTVKLLMNGKSSHLLNPQGIGFSFISCWQQVLFVSSVHNIHHYSVYSQIRAFMKLLSSGHWLDEKMSVFSDTSLHFSLPPSPPNFDWSREVQAAMQMSQSWEESLSLVRILKSRFNRI